MINAWVSSLSFTQYFLLVLASLVAVYVASRIIFAAYFAAKAAYLRRFFNGSGETTRRGRDS